jgi:hypothetical protein
MVELDFNLRFIFFQVIYGDVYMLEGEGSDEWQRFPGMPRPDSHIECAWIVVNDTLVVLGGTTEKDPLSNRMVLVGEVFAFDFIALVCVLFFYFSLIVLELFPFAPEFGPNCPNIKRLSTYHQKSFKVASI